MDASVQIQVEREIAKALPLLLEPDAEPLVTVIWSESADLRDKEQMPLSPDETCLCHTIDLKSTTLSFKNQKRIERPESEQLLFEDTHEALVTQQTRETVQDIRKKQGKRVQQESAVLQRRRSTPCRSVGRADKAVQPPLRR